LGRYAALCITGAAASSSAEKDSDDDDDDDDAVVGSSAAISPSLILWDLIGRLVGGDDGTEDIKRRKNNNAQQSGLFDSNWSTRCNCAMALEYVAKCLPLEDRRHFFEGGDVRDDNDKDDDHTDHYDDNLWLSVNDLYRVHQEPNVNVSKTTADTKDCNLTTKLKTQPATQEHETNISPLFKNQLDIVIERGRLLLSSSGEQYNWNCNEEANEYIRENEELRNLDATAANVTTLDDKNNERHNENNHHHLHLQQSFLQKRVALQRQILSRRLGLGGILSAPIMNVNDDENNNNDASLASSSPLNCTKPSKRRRIVDEIVADEDLVVASEIVSSSAVVVTSKSENGQQNHSTRSNNDNKMSSHDSSIGIRALLVLESKRSENNPMGGSKHARHRNPQTLLGSELAYRTFDSEWTVRHGALLGTLSLLRAWRIHDSTTTYKKSQQRLGKWPHDILARCICILALDQFSDFSGSDLSTNNKSDNNTTTDDIVSNAVVAPVREMAAQIVAILLEVSPLEVWNRTHELLMRLYSRMYHNRNIQERGSLWEINHGVLLAWKYIIAITLFQSNGEKSRAIMNLEGESSPMPRPLSARLSRDKHNETSDRYHKVFTDIISHAIKGISDGNDDNRAVSAQILRYCLRLESQFHTVDIVKRCSGPLWIAVTKIGDISSCASDLLSLLAEVLSSDCSSFLSTLREANASFAFDSVLQKLSEFIDHDSAHVSISTYHAVSLIADPIVKAAVGNDGQDTDNIHSAICKLLNRIFKTYFTNTCAHNGIGEINRVRDLAWTKIIDAFHSFMTQNSTVELPASTSFVSLTLQYFRARDLYSTFAQEDIFDSLQKASHALALFYEKVCSASKMSEDYLQNIVAVVIEAMLQSPWVDQCEAACLLQVAISSTKMWDEDDCRLPSFTERQLLTNYLTTSPISILLKEHPEARLLLDDCKCRLRCGDRFSVALDEMTRQRERSGQVCSCADIIQDWDMAFAEKGVSFQDLHELPKAALNQTSMRLSASIAGALTSLGCKHLPTKITPLIRTLFTSLKNEQSYQRRRVTCRYIAELVMILSDNDSYSKAKTKLLENVCNLACEEGAGAAQSSQGATLAIEFFIENIDSKKMNLQDFNPIWERLSPLRGISRSEAAVPERHLAASVFLLSIVSRAITTASSSFDEILGFSLQSAVAIACFSSSQTMRTQALASINNFCRANLNHTMDLLIPSLLPIISDLQDDVGREGGCELLLSVLQECGVSVARYVPQLLPASMRLMTDAIRECSKVAASIFAILVRIAPLAAFYISNHADEEERISDRVINHLILGKPMPPCVLPDAVSSQLKESRTVLRPYQVEGISWLKFLNDVKLNGALCDDMG
jgi:hypothetical protein